MVLRCIAYDCSSVHSIGVSLHKFPKDPRRQWVKQVQRTRADWKGPSEYSILCSKHFTPDCFETNSALASQKGLKIRVRLKSNAIPTVFERSVAHSLQASE